MVNCTDAVASATGGPVSNDAPAATYYLVQKSRTGYVYVTYYATRRLEEALRHLDDEAQEFYHRRVVDIRTGHVHRVKRPRTD